MPEGKPTHEARDVSIRGILWFAGSLTVAVALVFAGVWGLGLVLAHQHGQGKQAVRVVQPLIAPPKPQLQQNPRQEMQKLNAADEALLHSYGWVDRSRGVIRIPIERAMELIAERGLPARTSVKEAKP